MRIFGWLRALVLSMGGLLASCDGIRLESLWVVDFAQPFPATKKNVAAFPPRHQVVYTAADSSRSLCIGRTAVWRQELNSRRLSRRELTGEKHHLLADSTYQEKGVRHYLHRIGRDSVRDSWLACDTFFNRAQPKTGQLRRFQGHYYLNTPSTVPATGR